MFTRAIIVDRELVHQVSVRIYGLKQEGGGGELFKKEPVGFAIQPVVFISS